VVSCAIYCERTIWYGLQMLTLLSLHSTTPTSSRECRRWCRCRRCRMRALSNRTLFTDCYFV